jgi:predicted alpha/beta hydrolase
MLWPAGLQRWSMVGYWYLLLPLLTSISSGDSIPYLKIPPRVAEQWYKSGRRVDYIFSDYFQVLLDEAESEQHKEKKELFHVELDGCQGLPVKFFAIENDPYAPHDAAKELFDRIMQAQKKQMSVKSEFILICGEEAKKMGHFGFFAAETTWWNKITEFMKENVFMDHSLKKSRL